MLSVATVLTLGMTATTRVAKAADTTETKQATERLVPTLRDGKFVGFKTYALARESRYARAGCQNGDTIEAIDGVAITSPEDLGRIETGLARNGVVELTVRRRGNLLKAPLELRR
jgi:type II secretory pathway component PulC